jgi:hypothetical protein
MIKSTALRIVFVLALAALAWLLLAGWATESPRDRLVDASVGAVMALLAIAVALPRRTTWALRLVAGIVGLAYVVYFGTELWDLLHAKPQQLRVGEPSATMAGLGLLIIGLPMIVFALSGTSILTHLMNRAPRAGSTGKSSDDPPAV